MMRTGPTSAAHSTATADLGTLVASWPRSLAARRVSPRTIATYITSAVQLGELRAAERRASRGHFATDASGQRGQGRPIVPLTARTARRERHERYDESAERFTPPVRQDK